MLVFMGFGYFIMDGLPTRDELVPCLANAGADEGTHNISTFAGANSNTPLGVIGEVIVLGSKLVRGASVEAKVSRAPSVGTLLLGTVPVKGNSV